MKKTLFFDTETTPIGPASVGYPDFCAMGYYYDDGPIAILQDFDAARAIIENALLNDYIIVAHNISFDLGVLGIIPREKNKIYDTMIADLLIRLETNDCAGSKPGPPLFRSLQMLSGKKIEGKGTTQLSFVPGVPLTPEQMQYLITDVVELRKLYERQQKHWLPGGLAQLNLQVRARMALTQMEKQGIRVDTEEIARQQANMSRIRRRASHTLKGAMLYTPARTGKRGGKYKAALSQKLFTVYISDLCKKQGIDIEYTPKKRVKIDKQFIQQFKRDKVVKAWLDYKEAQKISSTFLNKWDTESGRIHPLYRSLMRTGRTSSHNPNFQQIPGHGEKGKVKKVFLPEPGKDLWEIDYGQLELCCLAYLTQGKMLQKINAGEDLHLNLARRYFKREEITKDERALMKMANFGLPGGMGPASFRKFIRNAGLEDPGDLAARDLINTWMSTYPEMVEWRKDAAHDIPYQLTRVWGGRDEGTDYAWDKAILRAQQISYENKIKIPDRVRGALRRQKGSHYLETWLCRRRAVCTSKRTRCPVSYTEYHNALFQGLAADLTKDAISKLCLERNFIVHAFIHDAVLISAKTPRIVVLAAMVMLDSAVKWIPGVRVSVEISGPGSNWWEAKKQAQKITVQSDDTGGHGVYSGITAFYDKMDKQHEVK